MSKTYLYAKIGKSIKFNPSTWSAIGGDGEGPELIKQIAKLNPDDTFIIIGRNDLETSRKTIDIPSNIYSVYEGATQEQKKNVNYIIERLKDVKIDGAFLLTGPTANCNIHNKSFKRTELKKGSKEYAKSLETFQNYVAPVYNYLNESNIPWIMIANDPRYTRQGNDLTNQPKLILSQFDEDVEMQTFDNWQDQNYVTKLIPSKYAGMEKIFLINRENTLQEKSTKFMIVLNEGNNGVKSRYPELKKYVLDHIKDVAIYGKWDEETVKGDTRFKGPKKFEDLLVELPSVKYTFVIPIKPGWVTAKWIEMIAYGIIPFFHPDYDTQKHCNVPDFIRVKDADDLHKKIELLENDIGAYDEILHECLQCITPDDISGKTIVNTILSHVEPINKTGIEFKSTLNRQEKEINNEW